MLRAFLLAGDDDSARNVRDAHRRIGRVDVLAAGAGGPERIDPAVRFLDLDIDAVVDHRIDPHGGKARVAARVRIVGRDAHEAVNAGFGLQPAIGVVALDQERRALDAGLFAVGDFQELDLVFPALAPAGVHALQHGGPILALGAPGAGMHFHVGVVAVGLARQERLDLAAGSLGLEGADMLLAFLHGRRVALGLAEFDQGDGILEVLLEPLDGGDLVLERRALAHDLLRGLGIVPEVRVFGEGIQFGEAALGIVPVKDASSAVRSTAWFRLRDVRFRRAWCSTRSRQVVRASYGQRRGV